MWFSSKQPLSLREESHYIKNGLVALFEEADEWIPFSKTDNALVEKSANNQVVIGEDQLHIVDKQEMQLFPIYWDGVKKAVRRSNWFLLLTNADLHPAASLSMASKEQISSFVSLPPIWEQVIAAKYQETLDWISSSPEQNIERIVPLERPFNSLLIAFKSGCVNSALIIADEEGGAKFKLIRGDEQLLAIKSLKLESAEIVSSEPEHLLLAVHGIGQKFAGKMGHSFIEDVASLRNAIKSAASTKGVLCGEIAVLPVCWRMGTELFDREDFEVVLQKITLQSVPLFRSLISDAALDILLYMSTSHCSRIQNFITQEIVRLVLLFRKHHPCFNGKVHVLAHSLGSALIADVLACQNKLEEHSIRLGIIFAIGSPMALFGLLKEEVSLTKNSGKVAIYNIYHPADPIAYRLEPLLLRERPDMVEPAVPIPSSASLFSNAMRKVAEKVSERFLIFGGKTSPTSGRTITQSPNNSLNPLYYFNPRGRVDYYLQQGFFKADYISSLRAHFCYWQDRDVAAFVVNEIYSSIYFSPRTAQSL